MINGLEINGQELNGPVELQAEPVAFDIRIIGEVKLVELELGEGFEPTLYDE